MKVSGDFLVVLHRGRLHTVSTAGGGMRLVDSIVAYPPLAALSAGEEQRDWYNSILVSGDRIVVIGHSEERNAPAVLRYRMSKEGALSFQDSDVIEPGDDGERWASTPDQTWRLVGDQLVLYTTVFLERRENPLDGLPTLARRTADGPGGARPMAAVRDVFLASGLEDADNMDIEIHTVARCRLAARSLDCSATVLIASQADASYVSSNAVYLWMNEQRIRQRAVNKLYRLPLDGGEPQVVLVHGAPLDEYSFREDMDQNLIEVLVASDGEADLAWRDGFVESSLAVLRMPLARFRSNAGEAPVEDYRFLSSIEGNADYQNRFVGSHLLLSDYRHGDERRSLMVAPVDGDGSDKAFEFDGPLRRVEALGRHALVTSGYGKTTFSLIGLDGEPRILDSYLVQFEGEARPIDYLWLPDQTAGRFGQAVARDVDEERSDDLFQASASIMFMEIDSEHRLSHLGELASRPELVVDDGCLTSCTGWWANARPIFHGDRIFALLGYELIEGRVEDGAIREIGRLDFAPAAPPAED